MDRVRFPEIFWRLIEAYSAFEETDRLYILVEKSYYEYEFAVKQGKLFLIEFDEDGSVLVSLEKVGSWTDMDNLLNLVFSKENRGETPTTVYWLWRG